MRLARRYIMGIFGVMLVACVVLITTSGHAQHGYDSPNMFHFDTSSVNGQGGENISGPYQVDAKWPEPLPNGEVNARLSGVYAQTPDRIIVATTGIVSHELFKHAWGPFYVPLAVPMIPVFLEAKNVSIEIRDIIRVYNREGKMIEAWTQWDHLFKSPNRIVVNPYDSEHHVWVVDQEAPGVFEFTNDGKQLVMQILAKDLPAEDAEGFQDMAFMPDSSFYLVGGSRVIKFSENGKVQSAFGKPGSGPGEFKDIHGIVIDQAGKRLFIADRENARIQVVDLQGKYLAQWPNIPAPYCIRMAKDNKHIWISDGYTQLFEEYDLSGKLNPASVWGTWGTVPGTIWGPHYFDVDSEGNLYVTADYGGNVQKFVPRTTNIVPDQLVSVSFQ